MPRHPGAGHTGPAPTLLVVDDDPNNLAVFGELLAPSYRIRVANCGARALEFARLSPKPELILLDIMMPEMDGYEVLARLQADPVTRDIPVVFVTAMDSTADEEKGLALGAVDYITKPIRPAIVLARVNTQLELKRARDWLNDRNAILEAEVARRMADNERIQDVSIRALARLAETRDTETGKHILRTSLYVGELAGILQKDPRFAPQLPDRTIRLLTKSAPLHDIGKVGIPDAILLKRDRLDAAEWEIMKTHAWLGAQAIELAEGDAEHGHVDFLSLAKQIAHWHHERWDGSGYPDGLKGEDIPLAARLMTIADVFDALISRRVYKPALPYVTVFKMMAAGRGTQFDPDPLDAFLANFDRFTAIAELHRDEQGVAA